MQTEGPELLLVKSQWERRSSIFACNDYAVIAAGKIQLGVDECGNPMNTWVNDLPDVPMGVEGAATSSYLNTKVFIMAWDTLINSGKLWDCDFSIKADPDCVFFPSRLRQHVAPQQNANAYYLNCNYNGDPKLFGALEVFSTEAIKAYSEKIIACKEMDWKKWGEDLYMQVCLHILGSDAVKDYDLVGDKRCHAAPCSDTTKVSYHPFKDEASYWKCHTESADSARNKGLPQFAV